MANRYDISLDPVQITAQNDLPIIESDKDHIQDTIQANKGDYKENPADGVSIQSYLNSSGQETTISRDIILQLKADGYRSNNPNITFGNNGELQIEPNAILDI